MRFRLLLLIVRLVSHGSLPTEENDKVCNTNRLIQQLIEKFFVSCFPDSNDAKRDSMLEVFGPRGSMIGSSVRALSGCQFTLDRCCTIL